MKFNLNDLVYISKEDILERLREEDIFQYYLGISPKQSDIGRCIFKSPLREDSKPTCNFFYSGDKLMFKDYGADYGKFTALNCFNVVEYLFNCSYFDALKRIATDFGIKEDIEVVKMTQQKRVNKRQSNTTNNVTKKEIKITPRPWSRIDQHYWGQYRITLPTLEFFRVSPVMEVYLNEEVIFKHMKEQPIYAYYFYSNIYKIYRPLSSYGKWLSNTNKNIIQGYYQLHYQRDNSELGNICIITKSLKDVMFFFELGIPAISPQSENTFLSEEIIEQLFKNFDKVYINYDKDEAGLKFMDKQINLYPKLSSFLVPACFGSKDFTDLCLEIGFDKTKEIILELI